MHFCTITLSSLSPLRLLSIFVFETRDSPLVVLFFLGNASRFDSNISFRPGHRTPREAHNEWMGNDDDDNDTNRINLLGTLAQSRGQKLTTAYLSDPKSQPTSIDTRLRLNKGTRVGKQERPHFPLTLHVGSVSSNSSAFPSGKPTTTSALHVRRERIGI